MRVLLLVLFVLVGLAVLALIFCLINLARSGRRQRKHVAQLLIPITQPLIEGKTPDPVALENLAARPLTRNRLFDALATSGSASLFPSRWRTREAFAESELAYWLAHPNELNAEPDEMKLIKQVSLPSELGELRYLLFAFRVFKPHWAADKGWMAGIAGPFVEGLDLSSPAGTFSELEPLNGKTPEAHVQALHEKTFARSGRRRLQEQLPPKPRMQTPMA